MFERPTSRRVNTMSGSFQIEAGHSKKRMSNRKEMRKQGRDLDQRTNGDLKCILLSDKQVCHVCTLPHKTHNSMFLLCHSHSPYHVSYPIPCHPSTYQPIPSSSPCKFSSFPFDLKNKQPTKELLHTHTRQANEASSQEVLSSSAIP
jgi:hypothetical protein